MTVCWRDLFYFTELVKILLPLRLLLLLPIWALLLSSRLRMSL
jgi:hypothetical protein